MADLQDYSEIVARAEKAVASVKDPELKRIAFQRVLDDLLGSFGAKDADGITARARKTSSKETSKGGPKAYIVELIDDGFFKKQQKTISDSRTGLANRGHNIPVTSLSGPLKKLCQEKRLRRQKDAASGTYTYSEW